MQLSQLVRKLGPSDAKLMIRDKFMIGMFVFIVYIIAVLRFGLPWANGYLDKMGVLPNETILTHLADYYPLIIGYFCIYTGAILVGTIFGFMLLDERDQHTLKAMLVTPVRLEQYVLYRVGLPAVMAVLVIMVLVYGVNIALLPWWQMLLISIGASLIAPVFSLFYASFAANKVQGFAFGKFTGVAGFLILLSFFIKEPFQWIFGLYPPYWINKAYWLALEGSQWWWAALILGIVLQIGMIVWFVQRFKKVAYRS